MNITPGRLILLDTSVLVHFARDDATGKAIEAQYKLTQRPERPLISSITEGEILAFATYHQWGSQKLKALEQILTELVRVDAGHRDVVKSYAELYCFCRASETSCDQNDLWIAATAKAANAVLFTCDRHFDGLHGQITGIYVPESSA